MESHRPSKTVEFEAEEDHDIIVEPWEIVAHAVVKDYEGKHRGRVYAGNAIPKERGTFKDPGATGWNKGKKKVYAYHKTRFLPRDVVVIVDDISPDESGRMHIKAKTKIFITRMNTQGVLSSLGPGYDGKTVTLIIQAENDAATNIAAEKIEETA